MLSTVYGGLFMIQEQTKENKMGTMPINKLLFQMSMPMIISMLIQALYNIVDSIFVAQISENALTAVSLAFPYQNIMIAIASGTGVGVNAVLSRSLGEKNFEKANRTACTGIVLSVISYLVIAISGILFSKKFFALQTDIQEIIDYGYSYLIICTVLSFGIFLEIMFERLLQSTGKTIYTMFSQGIGAIFNIIFDPILIFGLLGFPEMGIKGAALATVLGQILSMIIALIFNLTKNNELKFRKTYFYGNSKIIKDVYAIAIPSILMMSIGSVMTFSLNKILIAFTTTATAVLGVYFKLQSFIFMPIFGLNNGMVPIVAYNYGAMKKARVTKTIKSSIFVAESLMFLGVILFQFLPKQLLGFFNASQEMLAIGVPALRIICLHFLLAGFAIISTSVFQALGAGVYSLIVSASRQLLVLIPAAYLLSLTGNVNNVWWAFPIAELISVTLCTVFLKKLLKVKFD